MLYREQTTGFSLKKALLRLPHMLDFIAAPQGTMTIARHLHRIGTIKTMPKAWTDFYLPVAHDLPGN